MTKEDRQIAVGCLFSAGACVAICVVASCGGSPLLAGSISIPLSLIGAACVLVNRRSK